MAWHSDPPSPLRGLQTGSQLMANACTRLLSVSVPHRRALFFPSRSSVVAHPLVRVQRPRRGNRTIRAASSPLHAHALRLVPPPHPPRRGLRVTRRRVEHQRRPGILCPRRTARGLPRSLVRVLATRKARFRADRAQCIAGDATWRKPADVESLRVYVLVQHRQCHFPFTARAHL